MQEDGRECRRRRRDEGIKGRRGVEIVGVERKSVRRMDRRGSKEESGRSRNEILGRDML